jgi:hypothetical protein
MKNALRLIGDIVLTLLIIAACMLWPALLTTLAINWLAPQFDVATHFSILQAWVGLFVITVVCRSIFTSITMNVEK